MSEWILIITILIYGGTPAVTPVYGFKSEQSCRSAGMYYVASSGTKAGVSYACVSK